MIKLKIQIIFFGLLCIFSNLHAQNQNDCSSYKSLWFSKKYPYNDELSKLSLPKPTKDVCSKTTCCDKKMQNEIVAVSHLTLKTTAETHLNSIIDYLFNSSNSLSEFYQADLDLSKKQLDQMFTNTYHSNYKMHQQFFYEFYDKLKLYMEGNEQKLEKILENFFHEMVEKILTMMVIAKKDIDSIRCMTNNFLKLDSYGTLEKSIIKNFVNVYPPARMLLNSMRAAQDVFLELSQKKMTPTLECAEIHARAFHCSLCAATKTKPCDGLCKSVMGKCFGSLNLKEMTKLGKSWKKLLTTIERLSKKLKHPFNFPEVNKNLHMKISDAIMTVHNLFPTFKERIWMNCKSQNTRKRRSENRNYDQFFDSLPKVDVVQKPMHLSEIIDKFSTKVPEMSQHLIKHKIVICNKLNLLQAGSQCWNGMETVSSYKPEPKDKSQIKNLPIDPIVQSSINKLNQITLTLSNLLLNKNTDPNTFKINYVKKPKKVEISRPRPSRITESIEGSGDVDSSDVKTKPELPITSNSKPVEPLEGSGSEKQPATSKSVKERPAFPEIPTVNQNQNVPKKPIQKPTISDDEDIVQGKNENEKDKTNKPFGGNQVPIEGSGSPENIETSTESFKIVTTTTTTAPILTPEPEKPPKEIGPNKNSGFPEGSGQSPDDETNSNNKQSETYPKVSVPQIQTTTAPANDKVSTVGVMMPNELPGDIPSEIWIPRVVDYDSYGRMVSNPNSKASNVYIGVFALQISFLVNLCIYKLM